MRIAFRLLIALFVFFQIGICQQTDKSAKKPVDKSKTDQIEIKQESSIPNNKKVESNLEPDNTLDFKAVGINSAISLLIALVLYIALKKKMPDKNNALNETALVKYLDELKGAINKDLLNNIVKTNKETIEKLDELTNSLNALKTDYYTQRNKIINTDVHSKIKEQFENSTSDKNFEKVGNSEGYSRLCFAKANSQKELIRADEEENPYFIVEQKRSDKKHFLSVNPVFQSPEINHNDNIRSFFTLIDKGLHHYNLIKKAEISWSFEKGSLINKGEVEY